MDVYILCVLLTESFAVCRSKRKHFLEHPWQHWQFCMSCPWSPSGVKAFTWDISTPLRRGHDIPEGCPRAVKVLLLLQLPSSCLLSCASTQLCVTVHLMMCIVSCQVQLKDASDQLFLFFWLFTFWVKGTIKDHTCTCFDGHPASPRYLGVRWSGGTTCHARNRLTYIIHDGGYYPSQRPSVVAAHVVLICSHS